MKTIRERGEHLCPRDGNNLQAGTDNEAKEKIEIIFFLPFSFALFEDYVPMYRSYRDAQQRHNHSKRCSVLRRKSWFPRQSSVFHTKFRAGLN